MKILAKNRRIKILLLPILGVLFLIGYALSIAGQSRHQKDLKRQPNKPTQNPSPEIEIGVLAPPEEQPLITHQNKQET
jgi:hypothetical protein